MYPKEVKTYIYTKVYPQILLTALFIIVPNFKRGINKLLYIHTVEYYLARKRNAL